MIPYCNFIDIKGKTVKDFDGTPDTIYITWSDGTFSSIEYCEDGLIENDKNGMYNSKILLKLGIISQEEYDEHLRIKDEKSKKSEYEYDMKVLKQLSEKYGLSIE